MQALFYMDTGPEKLEDNLALFLKTRTPPKKSRSFFLQLVRGVMAHCSEIDTIIERFSKNWRVTRMSAVDRNVIRIAIFELICCEDIPVKVSINEAIDIGKKYGTKDSGAFINGILDSIHLALQTEKIEFGPAREALPSQEPHNAAAVSEPKAQIDTQKPILTPINRSNGMVKRRRHRLPPAMEELK